MTTPRLRSVVVKGFRSYGAAEQTLNLPGNIAVVWGPNSKGKTGLAEAFEFLLTGRISRRELMASSQDEFTDALRNAHLAPNEDVYVAARITAPDGTSHEIRRVLTGDYAKKQDCASRLEIDGAAAVEDDLTRFGIILSQPPLQAPVLAQHTLSYIFSVRPQDRTTYFKTLLEVTDLDVLRNDIAAMVDELKPLDDPLLTKFDTSTTISSLKPALTTIARSIPDITKLTAGIAAAAGSLIKTANEKVPDTLQERLASIDRILADRRSKAFPVRGFERKDPVGWNPPPSDIWTRLDSYLGERKKVDEKTRQLIALFDQALKLPTISQMTGPTDCPLCGTDSALTPERVQFIREQVANSAAFNLVQASAKAALPQLSASASALATDAQASLPRYLTMTGAKRREIGFTIARIRQLLGGRAPELVGPFLCQVRPLRRAAAALRHGAQEAAALVQEQTTDIATALDPQKLQAVFSRLPDLRAAYIDTIDAYKVSENLLFTALAEVLDANADTAGWQDFLDVARAPNQLRVALVDRASRVAVGKELDAALKQIDRAKEQVLDDKFSDFSGLIQAWWERLRPDEATFFSAVHPRKGTKRTIDFKAGLSANPDRSAPKVRDVIAVFSQSQLHCLGVAMFLARAQHDGLGFIVLDDPVLSSDDDYRVHFNLTVLTELLALPIQVIILTQDHATWEELEIRYRHLAISTAQLYIDSPAEGSIIENTSDALIAKINRAKSLARGGHPDLRKECGILLRDAGERFCKEMLVVDQHRKGNAQASLTDYDGKTLEWLSPHVDPLLDRDASHPGKFAVFRKTVNNACHDNAPPSNAEMTLAHGDIRFLVKQYLGR